MGINFKSNNKKVIISIITVIFIFSNFYFLLFWQVNKAEATIPVIDSIQVALHGGSVAGDVTERITTKIWDEIKAVFFKNVLGNLSNLLAQQAAVYVASGGAGEAPQFITDFEGFITGYAEAAVTDFVATVIQDLTGINICTLDPSISIDLAINIPTFPEWSGYKPSCDWQTLRSHWEKIGQKSLTDFISADFGIGQGGQFAESTELMSNSIVADETLMVWDIALLGNGLPTNCPERRPGKDVICPQNDAYKNLAKLAADLDKETAILESDVNLMLSNALQDNAIKLSVGSFKIVPENINIIKKAWLDKLNPKIEAINKLVAVFSGCKNKSATELSVRAKKCEPALVNLNVASPPTAATSGSEDAVLLSNVFEQGWREKINYIESAGNSLNSGFEYLKNQVSQQFTPEFFEGSAAYNTALAKDLFNPEANEFNAYEQLSRQIAAQGLSAYLNQNLQAGIGKGWKAATDRIGDTIRTPANMISEKSVEDVIKSKGTAKEYTKSVAADALGVFMETLWNQLIQRLLEGLAGPSHESYSTKVLQEQSSAFDLQVSNIYNPFEQEIISQKGVERYVETLVKKYTVNYTFKALNLLADFQLKIDGQVNPNLYNNVIDSNLAIAINDKLTIAEAINQNKLIGDFKFSWDEDAEAGTYHLANIKKLRKARVVPLGLELAVELIRDCNYRKSEAPDFVDISQNNLYGFDDYANHPYKTQRLRNCLFKPYSGLDGDGDDDDELLSLEDVRNINKQKMNLVLNATLADVVNGFARHGSEFCGSFDIEESPFCNLVDPNWVLKLPATQCSVQTDLEPYNELLVTNDIGQRYSSCPDLASCLQEDARGGCVGENYGFCVKEKNEWQFGVDSCPSEFNSCTTFKVTGDEESSSVSYLKNTLSGSDICSAANAGCEWYATKKVNGAWVDFADTDEAQSERIYLNRYAQECARKSEGCNEFSAFRNPNNNLIFDSSFEYTKEGYFPQSWDFRLKTIIYDKAECGEGIYTESCLIDGIYNNNILEIDCLNDGHEFNRFCNTSLLQYDRCDNPQFINSEETASEQCVINSGLWIEECEKDGVVRTELATQADCEIDINQGTWLQRCEGAVLYGSDSIQNNPQNKQECTQVLGEWLGEGPFSKFARITKFNENVKSGLSRLDIDTGVLPADAEFQLVYKIKFDDENNLLTKGGDVYTSSAYIATNQFLSEPITMNLAKINNSPFNPDNEVNSTVFDPGQIYDQVTTTLITSKPGNELDLIFTLPGGDPGTIVSFDDLSLYLNTIGQLRNFSFHTPYSDYEVNNKIYYKISPENLTCNGYSFGDPAPLRRDEQGNKIFGRILCSEKNGYWDDELVYRDVADCYIYEPDLDICSNYMKVCQPEEVGCQLYTPLDGDPSIPGVVSATDYCPADCVGFETYKQEGTLYEPEPENLFNYFIPQTAFQCSLEEVGCSQFTNLDEVSQGGEGVEYFTYLRQCIKPNLGLGEKTFFNWQGSATGSPQLNKYEFEANLTTGAPRTINDEGDCRLTIGENNLNCINFFDNQGSEYYRDIKKTISVSDSCLPYRKTESTEDNCAQTNGRWQGDISACIYDAIPQEAIACRAAANNCRSYIGNQGNNVFVQIFDNFETSIHDWESTDGGLALTGESIQAGGHSLFVEGAINSINKSTEINSGNLYTLSFWAKAAANGEKLTVRFSSALSDNNDSTQEDFASTLNQIELSSEWQNYSLGPVYVSWSDTSGNSLVFDEIDGAIYLDNILLKSVRDTVYVVKDSWTTPSSCNEDIYGNSEPLGMLGCQAYNNTFEQRHNLKSFSNLCRESVVGCELLIDTKNSINGNKVVYNNDNESQKDDYTVERDNLVTYVLDNNYTCSRADKGCQRIGEKNIEGIVYGDVYIKNNPDKYYDVPNAIMCNNDELGCTELLSDRGSPAYYKIEKDKLCDFKKESVNGFVVNGWFKTGSQYLGCGSIEATSNQDCNDIGGVWSSLFNQCTPVLNDVFDQKTCQLQDGEWSDSKCLASPFTIYKVFEANKYKGYVGQCSAAWSGCTEFIDINPNFVTNGSFEFTNEFGLSNWTTKAAQSGTNLIENNIVKLGRKSIKLIKRTDQVCPSTVVSPACGEADPYAISQGISLLEKGKSYKLSFYYNIPEDALGIGEECPLPQASVQLNRYIDLSGNQKAEGEVITYDAETGWKKVEYLFTVPHGECSDDTLLTKTDCQADAANIWTSFAELQNYELVIYAPRNENETLDLNNCPKSFIVYDQVEIKENTEDKYYLLDTGNDIDRNSCTSVDWDSGCVQFTNTLSDQNELIKVDKDRNCAEWAVCTQTNDDGECLNIDLCKKDLGGECVAFSAKKDNVRYDLDSEPLIVNRISDFNTQKGYIYRYGAGAFNDINQWRAGDYSGYTLAQRYPLESELVKGFSQYEHQVDLDSTEEFSKVEDYRYIEPTCKIFPNKNSPLPYDLSLKQQYSNIQNIYSPTYKNNSGTLGNMCSYEKVDAGSVITYFPINGIDKGANICMAPANVKGAVRSGDNCTAEQAESVATIKTIHGLEGMCLEFDILNSVYADVYKDVFKSCSSEIFDTQAGCETVENPSRVWGGPEYQPYACLTYYPFIIDLYPNNE